MVTKINRHLLWLGATAILIGLAVAVALLISSGYRAFVITTPSMGTAYPVGSVVVTNMQNEYHVGEPVTFTVDGERTYTHRISTVLGNQFTTRGDLNDADDAWTITKTDVIGKVVWSARGLGWVVKAIPLLALSFVVSETIIRVFRLMDKWSGVTRIISWSLTVAAINLWLRPFFNLVLLNWYANDADTVTMNVVGTGLFVMNVNEAQVSLGEVASVQVNNPNEDGVFTLMPTPALSAVQWVSIVLLCLLPLIAAAVMQQCEKIKTRKTERVLIAKRGNI